MRLKLAQKVAISDELVKFAEQATEARIKIEKEEAVVAAMKVGPNPNTNPNPNHNPNPNPNPNWLSRTVRENV